MKRTLLASFGLLLLVGCGSQSNTLALKVTFSSDEIDLHPAALEAAERVISRRVNAIEGQEPQISVAKTSDGATMDVVVVHPENVPLFEEDFTQPLDLQLMREADEGEVPDLMTENWGGFMKTGITEQSILWVTADEKDEGAQVTITFNDENKTKLQDIFKTYNGKRIGIFVREQLVSTYVANDEGLTDSIVISNVPHISIAEIFADDLNVGAHITFSARN